MLEEANWREDLGIKENEAEYLTQVELGGVVGHATAEMCAQELKTYRDRQAQLDLTQEEKQIILYIKVDGRGRQSKSP